LICGGKILIQFPKKEYKWLLLPIDNLVRELYSKLLLSVIAVEHGWGVIITKKSYIRENSFDIGGVVIEINMEGEERINQHKSFGRRVCAWDEEGLIYTNGKEYCLRRINESAIRNMDYVFLWGENQQKDILNHTSGIEDKLILSGNPRIDLLRSDLRKFFLPNVEQIRQKFGKYILVNTNFGVNHYFGRDYQFNDLVNKGLIKTKEQKLDQIEREKYQYIIMQAFLDLLPVLSKNFPQYKIIIRPHPSENFDTWKTACKDLPNVVMIHEGDAVPWLLGAEVIIHNSCTTGVQSFLMDKPVISYMPVQSEKYDQYLPNELSHCAKDVHEVIALIQQLTSNSILIDKELEQQKKKIAQKFIAGIEGPLIVDRIMNRIDSIDVKPQKLKPISFSFLEEKTQLGLDRIRFISIISRRLRGYLRALQKKVSSSQGKNWETYTQQRYPVFSLSGIDGDYQRLQKLTGRSTKTKINLICENLICIYPSEDD
jgi:surface carbohydrate biosynthesis protein